VTKLKDKHFHPKTMSFQSQCSSFSSFEGREASLQNQKENNGWPGLTYYPRLGFPYFFLNMWIFAKVKIVVVYGS
jgi:hypothetical protein